MKLMTKQDHAPHRLFQPRLPINHLSATAAVMDVCRARAQLQASASNDSAPL